MRIMLDTNILISAILFRSKSLSRLIEKVAEEYTLVLSTYVVDELKAVVERKFPTKVKAISNNWNRRKGNLNILSNEKYPVIILAFALPSKNRLYTS